MRISRVSLLVAAVAFSASATVARADSRAWTAAKKTLPANLYVVAGVNFGSIRSSTLFQQLWPGVLAKAGDAQAALDQIKQSCNIDLVERLESAVAGLDSNNQGAFVVALKGTTQKDLETCLAKFAKEKGKTLTITKAGPLTQYSAAGSDKTMYVRWLGKDVFAIATQPDDKDATVKWTSGGIATDKTLKAPLAASKTSASVWVVVNKPQDLADLHAKMLLGYGSAEMKGGTIAADLHLLLDSAKAAADAATQSLTQLNAFKKSGNVPPAFASILSTLQVKAAGAELVVSASMAEKDLMGIVAMMGMSPSTTAPAPPTAPTAPTKP
jgi:hypothetical protein